MAGDPTPVVNTWILDYNTYLAWEEFKLDHTISSSTLDSIAGILGKTWDGDDSLNDKKLFLTVLSRLKDGEDINMRYDETADVTPLEDLVIHFTSLVNFQIEDKLQEEGELLIKVIKCEAVQACCRAGDFEKGQAIYDNFFQKDKRDRVARTLRNYITKKTSDTCSSYSEFITAMVEYLEKIANNFEEPTIITAARIFMERKLCRHSKTKKSKESVNGIPQREVLEEVVDTNCNSNGFPKDKLKLRKLWDEKIKDMFGSDEPEETNKPSNTASKSPIKEPPARLSPKISKEKRNDAGDVGSLFKKPALSSRPAFKAPAPETSKSHRSRNSHEEASTSLQSSTPRRKNVPVSYISPVMSESFEGRGPAFQYRKNKGRRDRHEPEMSSTRCEPASDHDDIDLCSVYSMSSKRKWTEDETIEFYDAVKSFGVGKWAEMKDYLNTTRTNVMLKDKWRNMVKSGEAERISQERKKKKH